MRYAPICFLLMFLLPAFSAQAQQRNDGAILSSGFVYTNSDFPSCHAATIVETTGGGIMIALFGGLHEGNSDSSIWTSHLTEEGWSEPVLVADGMVDGVKTACWNPVLFQVPHGELLLFYKVGPYVQGWEGYLIRSNDGGHEWSEPEKLPDGLLGPIKNKPIIVGGELLCGSSLERGGWRMHLETTDLKVTQWRRTGPVNNRKSDIQIIQPSLLVHKDGSIQALCRAIDLRGNIVSVTSRDGGRTWTDLRPTGLPNNDSGLDAVVLPNGNFLLVYNHINAPVDGAGARSPINIALSRDGREWYASHVLENVHGDEYSYPSAITAADGTVHIVYTWNRKFIKYVKIDPPKLFIDPKNLIRDELWPN